MENKDQKKTILKFWNTVSVTPKFISKLWETHGGHTRTSPNIWKVFDGCPRRISKLQKSTAISVGPFQSFEEFRITNWHVELVAFAGWIFRDVSFDLRSSQLINQIM